MVKQRSITIVALCASVFALCVIGLGAFTRLIDAGLGCPDWPGCYGHLTVPALDQVGQLAHFVSYKAWAEMIHRYFAGTLSSLILILVVLLSFRIAKNIKNEKCNLALTIFIVLLVIYQIMLGQWTVTLKLLPIIVTQHLLGGFLILSTLWLIYLNNKPQLTPLPTLKGSCWYFILALGFLMLVLLQIFLGAWTSTNYASLSCPDFPFCQNDQPTLILQFKQAFTFFTPIGVNYDGGVLADAVRQTIQMTHRFGALIVTLYAAVFSVLAIPQFKSVLTLMKSIYLIWGLLILQLCLGMTNVIFKLPLLTAIAHNLTAVLLLLTVLTLVFKLSLFLRKVS